MRTLKSATLRRENRVRPRLDEIILGPTAPRSLPDHVVKAISEHTTVWLTIEQIQLVANVARFGCGEILRKRLQNGHFLEQGEREDL